MASDENPPKPWSVPPLEESKAGWQPPPISVASKTASPNWSAPPVPRTLTVSREGAARTIRFPRLRRWHLLIVVVAAAIGANYQRLPWVWAEIFYREPTEEWIRAVATEKLPTVLANGKQLAFQIAQTNVLREADGMATVTVAGKAVIGEPLYESVSLTDPSLDLENKLRDMKAVEERALFLHDRAGIDVKPIDENAFRFVRETAPAGASAPFEFQFKAQRAEMKWVFEKTISVTLVPATSLPGKLLADLNSDGAVPPSILGTEKAKQDITEFNTTVDRYLSEVSEGEKKAQNRFAAEGKDANGNFLFPPDRAMPGERFAETRMRILQSDELQQWKDDDLQYAINEIFARHGAPFGDTKLAAWFKQFTWYHPEQHLTFDAVENSLPDIELQNVKMLGYLRTSRREIAQEQKRAAALQQKQAAAAQRAREQQAAAAQKAQQEAEQRAQQQQAAEQIVGGLLQGIINSIPK